MSNVQITRHHLLFEKVPWLARSETRTLRADSGLIVRLAQDAHSELHQSVTTIPIPNIYMLRSTLSHYERGSNIFENVDNLCFAVDEAMNHPKSNQLDKQLGGLIIESLELQVPFIREGRA